MCLVSRVAGVALLQVPAWRGEQLHREAGGTCFTKLGVHWKIHPSKMRMGLTFMDDCTEIAAFTSNGRSPLRDPLLQTGEILAVTCGAAFSGMYREHRILKNFPACGGVIGENLPLSIFLSKHWVIASMMKAGFQQKHRTLERRAIL